MKNNITLILVILLAGCTAIQPQPETPTIPAPQPTEASQAGMPNPASVFCEEQGYTLEIRTATDGSQYAACIFPDGSECEEWAFFRGECGPGQIFPSPDPTGESAPAPTVITTPLRTGTAAEGWLLYCYETLGLSFQYPQDAAVELDSTGYTISVTGPVVNNDTWPMFMISFPRDRQEYRLPAGADLRQWLVDHNMLMDEPQPDVTIAGTTAIHARFAGSPQSYANDRYFFAHDGQIYVVLIGHTGNHEDWELYNQFLGSIQFFAVTLPPAPISTALPIDPAIYQDWITYTNAAYGFSFRLPDNWFIEESATDSHLLTIYPIDFPGRESIRLTFRRAGEEALLWPTGVGEGEFIAQDTLDIAGQPAVRLLLVCPAGEVTAIWYHQSADQANLARGDLEFGIIFSATPYHCQDGFSLSGELQRVGESIIASLMVP